MSLSACGGPGPQQAATANTAPAPAPAPPDVAVYVTNETSGDLSIIDAATGTAVGAIPLGKRPRGLVASPDRRYLYVALSGSPVAGPGVDESTLPPPDRGADGIGVVDLTARKLLKVLTSGTDPEQVAINAAGTHLYVANEDAALMSVIDIAGGTRPRDFQGRRRAGRCVGRSERTRVGHLRRGGHRLCHRRRGAQGAQVVKVGPRPRSVAFAPDGSRAYVPSEMAQRSP